MMVPGLLSGRRERRKELSFMGKKDESLLDLGFDL